jgi:anti-sigma regulatory factor (Ser/Thr protein kinase)
MKTKRLLNKLKSHRYSFELTNDLAELKALNLHLVAFGGDIGLPEHKVSEINVCLDELFTNIVLYGFDDGGEHKIRFSMSADDSMVIATIEDDGLPFNPLKKKAVKPPETVEDAKIGGLGIHITRELMDKVSYERIQGRNRITIKKRIPANENPTR